MFSLVLKGVNRSFRPTFPFFQQAISRRYSTAVPLNAMSWSTTHDGRH
jgi:hypothetical protein